MANGKYRDRIDEFGEHYQGCHTNLTCTTLNKSHKIFAVLDFIESKGTVSRWDIVYFIGHKGSKQKLRGIWSAFFHDVVWIGVLKRNKGQYTLTNKGKILLDRARKR